MKKILVIFILLLIGSNTYAYTKDEAAAKLEEMCRDPHDYKSFFLAIHSNESNIVDLYIDSGIDLKQTYFSNTPLVYALADNRPEIALNLMKHGADFYTPHLGNEPLVSSVIYKQDEPAVYMIEHGAYEKLSNTRKRMVLFYAVKNNLTGTVEAVLNRDPNADIKRSRGLFRAPLITTARRHQNDEMVDMLINHMQKYTP